MATSPRPIRKIPDNPAGRMRYNLRQNHIELPRTTTNRLRNSAIPTAIRKWNTLDLSIQTAPSLSSFKMRYKNKYFLKQNPLLPYGPKRQNSIIAKFRMAFPPLNSYLFSRQLIPDPGCSCGSNNETSTHFFLSCPIFAAQRNRLFREVNALITHHLFKISQKTHYLTVFCMVLKLPPRYKQTSA